METNSIQKTPRIVILLSFKLHMIIVFHESYLSYFEFSSMQITGKIMPEVVEDDQLTLLPSSALHGLVWDGKNCQVVNFNLYI